MSRSAWVAAFAVAVLLPSTPAHAAPPPDPASYVNPFMGTQGGGPDFGHGGGGSQPAGRPVAPIAFGECPGVSA
ncbi:hypothetical protein ACIBQ1_23900 [Nonomuraea sp. NPDC050153]|uniref:hypothetical protein n=1 Tax=Nonomuraea sp. NPDC050153 TaxID=3364359 RepID=UPI0037B3E25B